MTFPLHLRKPTYNYKYSRQYIWKRMLIILYLSALICGAQLFHITKTCCAMPSKIIIVELLIWFMSFLLFKVSVCILTYTQTDCDWWKKNGPFNLCFSISNYSNIPPCLCVFTACWFSSSLAFPLQCWHVAVKLAAYTGCLENMFKQFECCFGAILFVPKLINRVIPEPRAVPLLANGVH